MNDKVLQHVPTVACVSCTACRVKSSMRRKGADVERFGERRACLSPTPTMTNVALSTMLAHRASRF